MDSAETSTVKKAGDSSSFGRTGLFNYPGDSYALLIDGDVFGPSHWSSMLPALRKITMVKEILVFGAPRHGENPRWQQAASKLNIVFKAVPRMASGAKDPNDIAIAATAMLLVARGDVSGIALAVQDADFVYLADHLHAEGYKALLVLPESNFMVLGNAFKAKHAGVVRYRLDGNMDRSPKKKAVLQANGSSLFHDLKLEPDAVQCVDFLPIISFLKDHGYIVSDTDPVLPGIAKLCYSSGMCPVTVWPLPLAVQEAIEMVKNKPSKIWRPNQGNLVFVFPRGRTPSLTRTAAAKYGSRACADVARAGGPFIMEDAASSKLIPKVLSRMGFLDEECNTDVSEAIDVFCGLGLNRKTLSSVGIYIAPSLSLHSKLALLHTALVLPQLHGEWQKLAPDTNVRRTLLSRRLISTEDAPVEDVFKALRKYAKERQIATNCGYNMLVSKVTKSWNQNGPSLRQ